MSIAFKNLLGLFSITGLLLFNSSHGQTRIAHQSSLPSAPTPDKVSLLQDSLKSSGESFYQMWFDGAAYLRPFTGTYTGSFLPTYSVRVGVGISLGVLHPYGFLEFTRRDFDPPDALFPPFVSSNKSIDVAAYSALTIWKTLFIGAGVYYTREDNIVGRDQTGTILSETGVRTYFRFFYLVGAMQQIRISSSLSMPIGLYFRDESADSKRLYLVSFRVGVIYGL